MPLPRQGSTITVAFDACGVVCTNAAMGAWSSVSRQVRTVGGTPIAGVFQRANPAGFGLYDVGRRVIGGEPSKIPVRI